MLIRRPEAEQDLIDIYLHVSRDNPTAAEKLVRAIDAKCERLARSPMIGRARPELRPNLRSFPFGAYLMLYRALDDGRRDRARGPRCAQSRRSCLIAPTAAREQPPPTASLCAPLHHSAQSE